MDVGSVVQLKPGYHFMKWPDGTKATINQIEAGQAELTAYNDTEWVPLVYLEPA